MSNLKKSEKWKSPPYTRFFAGQKGNERSAIRRKESEKIELQDVSDDNLYFSQTVGERCFDPGVIFPYSNRPNASRLSVMRKESQQWELFFDPQNTFGCFTHRVTRPDTSEYCYKGKWPLEYEDVVGMAPKHLKKSMSRQSMIDESASVMSAVEEDVFMIPSVPNPTMPDMNYLKSIANIDNNQQETDDSSDRHSGSMAHIKVTPYPPPLHTKKVKDEAIRQDRLGLLNAIQHVVFNEAQNSTRGSPFEESRTARIQRQIKDKAEKIKKETLVDRKQNESRESFVNEDTKDVKDSASDSSCRDFQEKVVDLDALESQTGKQTNRQTFYLFAFGFICPLLWVFNFALGLKALDDQTEASKNIDKKWRKYSRNAIFMYLLVCAVSLLIAVIINPGSFGFRKNTEQYIQEDVVLFDHDKVKFNG